jgi:hypothetical protein
MFATKSKVIAIYVVPWYNPRPFAFAFGFNKVLMPGLLNFVRYQGYEKIRLIRSLKKFIFRYQDLVEIYSVSAEKFINDGFAYSENV